MPTKRKRTRPRTGADKLTREQVEYLEIGMTILDPEPGVIGFYRADDLRHRWWIPFAREADIESAWRAHRDEVVDSLRDYIAHIRHPEHSEPWAQREFD